MVQYADKYLNNKLKRSKAIDFNINRDLSVRPEQLEAVEHVQPIKAINADNLTKDMEQQLLANQEYQQAMQRRQVIERPSHKILQTAQAPRNIKDSFPYQIYEEQSQQAMLVKPALISKEGPAMIVLSTDMTGTMISEKILLTPNQVPANNLLQIFIFLAYHEATTPQLYRDNFGAMLELMQHYDIHAALPTDFFAENGEKYGKIKSFLQKIIDD